MHSHPPPLQAAQAPKSYWPSVMGPPWSTLFPPTPWLLMASMLSLIPSWPTPINATHSAPWAFDDQSSTLALYLPPPPSNFCFLRCFYLGRRGTTFICVLALLLPHPCLSNPPPPPPSVHLLNITLWYVHLPPPLALTLNAEPRSSDPMTLSPSFLLVGVSTMERTYRGPEIRDLTDSLSEDALLVSTWFSFLSKGTTNYKQRLLVKWKTRLHSFIYWNLFFSSSPGTFCQCQDWCVLCLFWLFVSWGIFLSVGLQQGHSRLSIAFCLWSVIFRWSFSSSAHSRPIWGLSVVLQCPGRWWGMEKLSRGHPTLYILLFCAICSYFILCSYFLPAFKFHLQYLWTIA